MMPDNMPRPFDPEHSELAETPYDAEIKSLRQQVQDLERENERLQKCRQELIDVTNACRDPRVNLTHTLEQCVKDAYAEIDALSWQVVELQESQEQTP